LIAENEDFAAFTPFASRFPFEMAIFLKVHGSAISRISPGKVEGLAAILRDVLQKFGSYFGRAALQHIAARQTIPATQSRVLELHRRGFPLAHRDTASVCPYHGIRMGIWFFPQSGAARTCCSMSLAGCRHVVQGREMSDPLFPLGQVVMTTGDRQQRLKPAVMPRWHFSLHTSVSIHAASMPTTSARTNQLSVEHGFRILSAYGLSDKLASGSSRKPTAA